MRSFFEKKLALLRSAALLSIFVFSIIGISYAWQNPTVSPPGGNVDAPVNTGTSTQYKAGGLGIGGVFRAFSDSFFGTASGTETDAPSVYIQGNTKFRGYRYDKISFSFQSDPFVPMEKRCICDNNDETENCPSFFYLKSSIGSVCYDYYQKLTSDGIAYYRAKFQQSPTTSMLGGSLFVDNEIIIGQIDNPVFHIPQMQFVKTLVTAANVTSSLKYYLSLTNEGLLLKNNSGTPSFLFSQNNTLSINTTTDKSMLTIWGNDRNNLLSIFATPSYPFVFVENRNGDGVMTIGNTKYINYIPLSSGLNVIGDNIILSNYKYPSGGVGVISKNVFAHATRDYFSDVSQYNNIKNRTGVGFRCDSNDDINIDQKNYYNGRDADPNYSVGSVCYDLFTEQVSGATLYGFNEFKVITTQVPSGPVVWQYEGLPSINFIDWRKSLSSFSLFNIGGIFRIQGGTSTILSIDAENKNVGINTISIPTTAALYVVGNIKATGDVCDGNRCLKDITGGGGPSYWDLSNSNLYPTNNTYKVAIGTTSADSMLTILGTSTNDLFSIYNASSIPALFVNSLGNIGIGTTAHMNYKLDIIGQNQIGNLRIGYKDTNGNIGNRFLLLGGDFPYIETQNSSLYVNFHNNQSVNIRNAALYISSDRKTGINTTSPNAMLTILGNSTNDLFSIYTTSSIPALFVNSLGKTFFNVSSSDRSYIDDKDSVMIGNKATIYITNTSSNGLTLKMTSSTFYKLSRSSWATTSNETDMCPGNNQDAIFRNCELLGNGGSCLDVAKFDNLDPVNNTIETEYLKSTVTCTIENDPGSKYHIVHDKNSLRISYASSSGSNDENLLYIFNNGSVSLGDKIYANFIDSAYFRGSSTRSLEADTLIARKGIFALNGYVIAKKLCFGLSNCRSSWSQVGGGSSYWDLSNNNIYPINNNYKVGVGTTSPNAMLTIRGISTNDLLGIYPSGTGTVPALFVKSDSRVGVGTASPVTMLHIKPDRNYDSLRVDSALGPAAFFINNSGNVGILKDNPTVALDVNGEIKSNATITAAAISSSGKLHVAGGNAIFEGKIGIGTTNPLEVLHIKDGNLMVDGGNLIVMPNNNVGGNIGIGTTSPVGKLTIIHNINNPNNPALYIAGSNQAGWGSGIQLHNISTNGKKYGIYSSDSGKLHIVDQTSGMDRIVINKDGNIGIGTNAPLGKLHVAGGNAIFEGKVGIGTNNPTVALDVNGDIKANTVKQKFCLNSDCTTFRSSVSLKGIYSVTGSGGYGTTLYCNTNDKVISAFMSGYGGNDNFGWEVVSRGTQEGVTFYPEANASTLRIICLDLE